MNKYLEENKKSWDERVNIHLKSSFYNVEGFMNGEEILHSIELNELGCLKGKTLLHLQCHFGLDTLALKRNGTEKVTGVDFSSEAIKTARELSAKAGIDAEFIESDIYKLPEIHNRKYDIVFTSYGALCWLNDIYRWAEIAASFVKPGGFLYAADVHPLSLVFDNKLPLNPKFSYFHADEPLKFEDQGSYADKRAETKHNTSYEWQHSLSDIVNAVIKAGLTIEFVNEHKVTVWEQFEGMEYDEINKYYYLKENRIPLLFSLKAVK